MALTVVSKPSGFRPVATGSLPYVFTEASIAGKPNYRVEIDLNGLGLPKMQFRPDAGLTVTCDIADLLRAALTLSETVGNRFKNTYVKYQAIWDTGSDAQVPLNADVIYFYAGTNNILNARAQFDIRSTGGPFLTPLTRLVCWTGIATKIDFLHDASLAAACETRIIEVDTVTITNTAFTGNVVNMESVAITFNQVTPAGQYATIQVKSVAGVVYATLQVEVRDYTKIDQPVVLKWLNDLGGMSEWVFGYNQELYLTPNLDQRFKEVRLFTEQLLIDQWFHINELNKTGVTYNDNLKVGQLLNDITVPGTPVGCYTVPLQQQRPTRAVGGQAQLFLRYPIIYNHAITQ